tara:strand:+ start:286 stop:936 length:651 start_codon:yes stop_codon:yes gene_type:complete
MNNEALNKNMVDGQIKPINGMTERIVSTFYSLDRNNFMPLQLKNQSYMEMNLNIEDGRVIPKPDLIAKIVLNINLKDNENVLILGSSTGYLAAILSYHAQTVIVVEENKKLLEASEKSIKENNINNVVFFNNEIAKGCLEQSPFNAIIIEGAVEEVPKNIVDQLESGGRMIAIISDNGACTAKMYKKRGQSISTSKLFNCSIPVLNSFKMKNSFSF